MLLNPVVLTCVSSSGRNWMAKVAVETNKGRPQLWMERRERREEGD